MNKRAVIYIPVHSVVVKSSAVNIIRTIRRTGVYQRHISVERKKQFKYTHTYKYLHGLTIPLVTRAVLYLMKNMGGRILNLYRLRLLIACHSMQAYE